MNNFGLTENGKKILETIVFFDIFDYPLTFRELHQFFPSLINATNLKKELSRQSLLKKINRRNGFIFLRNRSEIIFKRQSRFRYCRNKFKRAQNIAWLFGKLPWIKMIAVVNIIGRNNLRQQGDIDFFIITQSKRLWLSRFLCASFLKLFNLRPKPGHEADKICLSFWLAEDNLFLDHLQLKDDIYFGYWLLGLRPILDKRGYYNKILSVNDWIFKKYPNWQPACFNFVGKKFKNRKKTKNLFSIFFDFLEIKIKNFQIKIFPKIIKDMMNQDSRVVVGPSIIKLHSNDRRHSFQEGYSKKLKKIYED